MKKIKEKTVVITNDPLIVVALQEYLGDRVTVLLSPTKKTIEIYIVPIIIE